MAQLVVFIVGVLGMVLELVGVRVLAPYLGSSLIVWTSIIGVFLGSLSLGYYLGGRLSQKAGKNSLGFILAGICLFILTEGLFKEVVLAQIAGLGDLRTSSFLAATYLFFVPGVLMGSTLPVVIATSTDGVESPGRLAGRLYAFSTVGSIVGTFLGGFYLIPTFGTNSIFFLLGVSSGVLALLVVGGGGVKKYLILPGAFFLSFFVVSSTSLPPGVIADVDSPYGRLIVKEFSEEQTGRGVIALTTARGAAQSMAYADGGSDLAAPYTRFFRLAQSFNPSISKALMIGGGAYSYPKVFLKENPKATIDVVEIDPQMTKLARKYFNLKDDERLRIYHQDARIYLNANSNVKKYDAIYVDVFGSAAIPPFSITTKEALQKLDNMLENGGVVATNAVSAINGINSQMLKSQYATHKAVFKRVFAFKIRESLPDYLVQNIMLVATNSDSVITSEEFFDKLREASLIEEQLLKGRGVVLTDDFAPIEYYARWF